MHARSLSPKEEMRLFKGLAVQPFLAAAVAFLAFPVLLIGRSDRLMDSKFGAAMGVAIYTFVGALVITIFCVVPTTVWIVKRIRVSFAQSLAWGFAFANLPMVVATIAAGGNSGLLRSHSFFTLIGLAGATAFWTIAIRGDDLSRDPAMEDRTPEE